MPTVIDVSDVQSSIDWNRVAQTGIKGAYIKLSEGATFDARESYTHARKAEAAGIPYGFYHFARPDNNSPETEVEHVLRRMKGHKPQLKLVLDFEQGHSKAQYGDWAHQFSQLIRKRLGYFPIFYSYGPYIEGMRLSKPVGSGLWLAAYGRNDGREHPCNVPSPWKHMIMHQYSSTCRVPGCAGLVDLSNARSLESLRVH